MNIAANIHFRSKNKDFQTFQLQLRDSKSAEYFLQ